MTEFVTNVIQNSLSGFVAGAITTVGDYAGTAVAGVGNLIDERGQAVGDGKPYDLIRLKINNTQELRRSLMAGERPSPPTATLSGARRRQTILDLL
jgi:hypothetical protein